MSRKWNLSTRICRVVLEGDLIYRPHVANCLIELSPPTSCWWCTRGHQCAWHYCCSTLPPRPISISSSSCANLRALVSFGTNQSSHTHRSYAPLYYCHLVPPSPPNWHLSLRATRRAILVTVYYQSIIRVCPRFSFFVTFKSFPFYASVSSECFVWYNLANIEYLLFYALLLLSPTLVCGTHQEHDGFKSNLHYAFCSKYFPLICDGQCWGEMSESFFDFYFHAGSTIFIH